MKGDYSDQRKTNGTQHMAVHPVNAYSMFTPHSASVTSIVKCRKPQTITKAHRLAFVAVIGNITNRNVLRDFPDETLAEMVHHGCRMFMKMILALDICDTTSFQTLSLFALKIPSFGMVLADHSKGVSTDKLLSISNKYLEFSKCEVHAIAGQLVHQETQ